MQKNRFNQNREEAFLGEIKNGNIEFLLVKSSTKKFLPWSEHKDSTSNWSRHCALSNAMLNLELNLYVLSEMWSFIDMFY